VASISPQRDYVAVTYNQKDRPFTQYPDKLALYLSLRFKLPGRSKILDVGCGRGEFLKGFIMCGLDGYGVDQSDMGNTICPEGKIIQSNLENEPLPYNDNYFDIVFSKSVLEHFYYPERLVAEMYRVVRPGGLVITMVPDWESVYNIFFDDYTHRRPFTAKSLRDILLINGFNDVRVEKFRQLPFLWSCPWLKPFCSVVATMSPRFLRPYSKLIRFSQELMLLSAAVKPNMSL
jgi:SAM-dependent methyltransferase